jgi:hypothetical protein
MSYRGNFGRGSHTSSRTWRNQGNSGGGYSKAQLNEQRKKMCPRSPYWTQDFERARHDREYKAQVEKEKKEQEDADKEWRNKSSTGTATPINKESLFTGIKTLLPLNIFTHNYAVPSSSNVNTNDPEFEWPDNRLPLSAVLGLPTIFCNNCEKFKEEIAPWPSKQEAEYEGDGRIATDILHGRFLPLPRVQGNGTVQWQQRAYLEPYAFDTFVFNE